MKNFLSFLTIVLFLFSCSNDDSNQEELPILNEEIYLFKRNYENNNDQVSLVKFDFDNNTETIVYSLGNDFDQNESFSFYSGINAIFHQSKNEIITLNTYNNTLLRVNVSNGSETTNLLTAGEYENYNGLIINNNGELYLFKRNYENSNNQVSLIKYDLDSNTETIVYSLGNDFDQNESFSSYSNINAVFNPRENEIITLNTSNNSLLRINLTNGLETTNLLMAGQFENYNGLILK